MAMKRGRTDGYVSKETYYENESIVSPSAFDAGSFSRASEGTISVRRKVTAVKQLNRKIEYAKHVKNLNGSFMNWFRAQLREDPSAVLINASREALDYMNRLSDRYMTTHGEVLTFGNGDCGQLAHGVEDEDDLAVRFPRIVYSLRDKQVVMISCGGLHNAVVTEGGQVYTWGCADDGSLGRAGDESVPILVDALKAESIVTVACGDGQTIAVTNNGDVFGWGAYKDKEGKKWWNPSRGASNPLKDIKKQQDTPVVIEGLKHVVDVACGSVFNLALCGNGEVYSWGLGECGELGRHVRPVKGEGEEASHDLHAILHDHLTPGRMYASTRIVRNGKAVLSDAPVEGVSVIGCGSYHCMIVVSGESNGLFTCGLNNYGQLGVGDKDNRSLLAKVSLPLMASSPNVSIVATKGGMHHSMILTSNGKVFAFGRGDSCQLGLLHMAAESGGDAGECSEVPVLVPFADDKIFIKQISCGGNHNLALTASNEVYSWGYGDMLALGHGKEKDEPTPKKLNFSNAKIDNISVTQVAGGGQHSAIIGQASSY